MAFSSTVYDCNQLNTPWFMFPPCNRARLINISQTYAAHMFTRGGTQSLTLKDLIDVQWRLKIATVLETCEFSAFLWRQKCLIWTSVGIVILQVYSCEPTVVFKINDIYNGDNGKWNHILYKSQFFFFFTLLKPYQSWIQSLPLCSTPETQGGFYCDALTGSCNYFSRTALLK